MALPIDRLVPDSPEHTKVLTYLRQRIKISEEAMAAFYPRWEVNELKMQCYINLPDWEKELKNLNEKEEAPSIVRLTVPYSFATIWTTVTYLMHAFGSRRPNLQVGTYNGTQLERAANMETMLQYNFDHVNFPAKLFQFLQDGQVYNLGIFRTLWKEERAWRTRAAPPHPILAMLGIKGTSQKTRTRELVYQGNDITTIDPFMFFPDPRVPLTSVAEKGEFVAWRSYENLFELKMAEADGKLKWVKHIGTMPVSSSSAGQSQRGYVGNGTAQPGEASFRTGESSNMARLDQGTFWIIPKELGLSESPSPELWLFTIANDKQIVQAEPFDYDHGEQPVSASEPNSMGYGFGNAGILDYLNPIQDGMSWFINSHIENVRATMNNMFLVDPSMVEIITM